MPTGVKHISKPTPNKLRQSTLEKNMVSILPLLAERTLSIGRPMSDKKLIIGGKATPSKLPQKDPNFDGNFSIPQARLDHI